MPTINSLPNGASFGTQFDYSVWGPGTEVTLCNVPWDGMYRDVYWFDTPEKTIEYIRSFNSNKDIPTVTIKALTTVHRTFLFVLACRSARRIRTIT